MTYKTSKDLTYIFLGSGSNAVANYEEKVDKKTALRSWKDFLCSTSIFLVFDFTNVCRKLMEFKWHSNNF